MTQDASAEPAAASPPVPATSAPESGEAAPAPVAAAATRAEARVDPIEIRPTLCLTVGATGHRLHRLPGADLDAIAATMATILQEIGSTLSAVHAARRDAFAANPPRARLVSALADGADTIASQAALDAGWRVDACLPFARADYEADFAAGAPREAFNALLPRLSAVFELDGARRDDGAAYEAAGRVVLEQSDLIVALWDGDRLRGRGGTSQVVAEAVMRRIPVVHIDPADPANPRVLWSGLTDSDLEHPTLDSVPVRTFASCAAALVARLTEPPDHPVDRAMLARLYAERTRKRTPALPYPLLLALTGVRALSARDFTPPVAADSAAELVRFLTPLLQGDGGTHAAAMQRGLAQRYGIADAAASYFAQVFRSGFVANFLFGALAVLMALLGILWPAGKVAFILSEVAIVTVIVINTQAGRRLAWHERWMDYRHLAERLRAHALLNLMGHLDLRDAKARDAAAMPGWVDWLARATVREIGLPKVFAGRAYLAKVRAAACDYIDDQVAYHRANAERMHHLEHRLHVAGEWLFVATLLACLAWIGAKALDASLTWGGRFGATELVTVLTASLPSLGAALYGIRMQGDFAGVAFRSHETVGRLVRLKRALEADPLEAVQLTARLDHLAEIMLADVAHWRTTYQARPLALPG